MDGFIQRSSHPSQPGSAMDKKIDILDELYHLERYVFFLWQK